MNDAIQQRTEARAILREAIDQVRNETPARPDSTGTAAWVEARILQTLDVVTRQQRVIDVYVHGVETGPAVVTVDTPSGPVRVYVTYAGPSETPEGTFSVELDVATAGMSGLVLGFNGDGLDDETLHAAYSLVTEGMAAAQAVDVARSLTGKP